MSISRKFVPSYLLPYKRFNPPAVVKGKKPPVFSSARYLSRFIPIHTSALPLVDLLLLPFLRGNVWKNREGVKKPELAMETAERIVFGPKGETREAIRNVLEVRVMSFNVEGKKRSIPVVFARGHRIEGERSLLVLVKGEIKEVELIRSKEEIPIINIPEGREESVNRSLKGIPGSPGYGAGVALQFLDWQRGLEIRKYPIAEDQIEVEIKRFLEAREKAWQELETQKKEAASAGDEVFAEILEAYMMMVMDLSIEEGVKKGIQEHRLNAEHILDDVINGLAEGLKARAKNDPIFVKRVNDIEDIGKRIRRFLYNVEAKAGLEEMTQDVVIVSGRILSSDMAALYPHRGRIKGIVVEEGGPTAHAVVIARSLGIPAVIGISDATHLIHDADRVLVFGGEGSVVINPSEEVVSDFTSRQQAFGFMFDKIQKEVSGKPTQTRDGVEIALEGNIGSIGEIPMVEHFGASKIGLFRTEFVYMNRSDVPTEDELTKVFSGVKLTARIRTFDFGGDKKLAPYMPYLPPEETSFLGLRGIRLYFHDEWWRSLFATELRAILRASASNPGLQIMFPMVSRVREVLQAKRLLQEIMREFDGREVPYNRDIKVGIMVEVPSAVNGADEFAGVSDFFSIGSNDLIQYTLAVERENQTVSYLYDSFHRSVLWPFWRVISAGKKANIPVGLCGQLAADPLGAILLVGMGIDSLSMTSLDIPPIKHIIRESDHSELSALAAEALKPRSGEMLEVSGRERILALARERLSLGTYSALTVLEEQLRGRIGG